MTHWNYSIIHFSWFYAIDIDSMRDNGLLLWLSYWSQRQRQQQQQQDTWSEWMGKSLWIPSGLPQMTSGDRKMLLRWPARTCARGTDAQRSSLLCRNWSNPVLPHCACGSRSWTPSLTSHWHYIQLQSALLISTHSFIHSRCTQSRAPPLPFSNSQSKLLLTTKISHLAGDGNWIPPVGYLCQMLRREARATWQWMHANDSFWWIGSKWSIVVRMVSGNKRPDQTTTDLYAEENWQRDSTFYDDAAAAAAPSSSPPRALLLSLFFLFGPLWPSFKPDTAWGRPGRPLLWEINSKRFDCPIL